MPSSPTTDVSSSSPQGVGPLSGFVGDGSPLIDTDQPTTGGSGVSARQSGTIKTSHCIVLCPRPRPQTFRQAHRRGSGHSLVLWVKVHLSLIRTNPPRVGRASLPDSQEQSKHLIVLCYALVPDHRRFVKLTAGGRATLWFCG